MTEARAGTLLLGAVVAREQHERVARYAGLRERVQGSVSGLLALLGLDADPLRSREHVLLSRLDELEEAASLGAEAQCRKSLRCIQPK